MLPIHERFHTWQGEGYHAGRNAFFIRTFGCPLHCPWCDSAGTWHKDYVPPKIARMDEQVLTHEAQQSGAPFIVVTGGEPTIHDLTLLTSMAHLRNIDVHLETSGAFPIKGDFDWITLSPKRAKLPLDENIAKADEFKLIIESLEDLSYWANYLGRPGFRASFVWLHVEWSKRADQSVLNAMTDWVKTAGDPYRIGYQLHKLFKADALDGRAAGLVPLGGNPALGY